MSFLDKFKRAMGFGPDYDEGDEIHVSGPTDGRNAQTPRQIVDVSVPMSADPEKVSAIFNHVVGVINASLPQFLASSVDPEKQKKFLYDGLDESIKQYLNALQEEARERSRIAWQKESDDLRTEMENLRKQTRELEGRKNEISEKQLSAERQKRALSERVHDLEAQVISLEAEKEQFQIENKGMINKVKVASVYEKEIEEMNAQLEPILAQLEQFEDVKKRLEDKIAQQKVELEESQKKIESLNETIKDNLLQHASRQKALQDEIDNLRAVKVDESTTIERKSPAPEAPAINYPTLFNDIDDNRTQTDDLIGDTEWIK